MFNIDGSIETKKIDKTPTDFFHEWVRNLRSLRALISFWTALFSGSLVILGWVVPLPQYVSIGLFVLSVPIFAVSLLIFLVRTLSLLLPFLIRDIRDIPAADFQVAADTLAVTLTDGTIATYPLSTVERFLITYNWRGMLVVSGKRFTYSLPLEPSLIESRLDELEGFTKSVSSFQSKEGPQRMVTYVKSS